MLAIQSFNREEWLVADLAAMALGGVPLGIYTTSSAEQIEYILGHSEAEFFLVENAKYLATALKLRERLPKLRHIIVMDAPEPLPEGVLRYTDVLEKGTGADEGPYWERVNALEKEGAGHAHLHLGHHGQPQGGDAQPPQPGVDDGDAHPGGPVRQGRQADAVVPAAVAHRRAGPLHLRPADPGGAGVLRGLPRVGAGRT